MTVEFLPERTIRYKTYIKNTLVTAFNRVFADHPDQLLQQTQASGEFSRQEVDYPRVIVRFYERELFNAGVGHEEIFQYNGESDSIELVVVVPPSGASVQLSWAPSANAIGYRVYRSFSAVIPPRVPGEIVPDDLAPDAALLPGAIVPNVVQPPNFGDFSGPVEAFFAPTPTFTDDGHRGVFRAVPTEVTANTDIPQPQFVLGPPGQLLPGVYYYRVTAILPSAAVKFGHYFYSADIEFAVYGLTSLDRDYIADTVVQTIAMGRLEDYTNQFYDRIYPTQDLYPDSFWHFINVCSDRIQGFGENESQVPWGAEDELLYTTSYRVAVFGELYSLPPQITWSLVQKITEYPYIDGIDPVPEGDPNSDAPWVSNSSPV